MQISTNNDEHIFEQKYRPQTIDDCILPAEDKAMFKALVKKGTLPHLILQSNSPGTGKTTVAKALCNDTNAEMMFVNGADCLINFVRTELTRFASSGSIDGRKKVIVIDEFDRGSHVAESQKHLRAFMETYSHNCTIIITANNLEGIIKPLQDRAQVIKFGLATDADKNAMMKEMIYRCVDICKNENIEIQDMKVIAALVKKNFPSLRKTVNDLDRYSYKGVIDSGILSAVVVERGTINEVIEALKDKNIKDLRALAPRYAADYANFVEKLTNELYDVINKSSKIRLYELVGESNQYFGIAANIEIHIAYLLIRLAVEMQWQ